MGKTVLRRRPRRRDHRPRSEARAGGPRRGSRAHQGQGGKRFPALLERSAALRALIHETFNNRPAYLFVALQEAIVHAAKVGQSSTERFLELLGTAIRKVYAQREPKDGPKKADNLIKKTARL